MGVEKSEVRFEIDDAQAKRAARDIKREMGGIEKEAKEAQREVDAARGMEGRLRGLLKKGREHGIQIRDSDVTLGSAFKVGATGFGIRQTFMQGKAVGAAALPLAAVYATQMVAQTATTTLDKIADARDWWDDNQHKPAGQLAQSAFYAAADHITEKMFIQDLARAHVRVWGGFTWSNGFANRRMSAADAKLALDDLKHWAFGGEGLSPIEQQVAEQGAARRQFLDAQAKRDADRSRQAQRKRDAYDEAKQKIDEALAKRLRDLKLPEYPMQMPDELWFQLRREAELRERLAAQAAAMKLSARNTGT